MTEQLFLESRRVQVLGQSTTILLGWRSRCYLTVNAPNSVRGQSKNTKLEVEMIGSESLRNVMIKTGKPTIFKIILGKRFQDLFMIKLYPKWLGRIVKFVPLTAKFVSQIILHSRQTTEVQQHTIILPATKMYHLKTFKCSKN